ncbi:glycosyltransferase, group 2 family protein [Streptococcus cristatus ATCC 51100]|uniref:Undecaprenyl-phosphate mannosyltransferase n=2 Tax=Streptococcus cristatus TaxID=45634 RepID=A0A3R9LWS4_STRCR|nr:glycosyltransferase family 2 protein [Streptococcus cristatus]EFX53399.1 glycosyltransferase, group 2 family protein [Streptococcus cristatus ATCC 51100]EGU66225.1 glycosyltransferase, group 2 family protein [Streptococcus cristatus ATCC 51100]KJQ57284.1 glycosyl transferase family protein [Streptococcus cristatus]MCG7330541.1 glycosyltransferase family 2 protein [Streptococcus cristatus]RSJ73458.1 Undecaprenyl-phosphate mannosyltransferase [Streptococcus cristatus]
MKSSDLLIIIPAYNEEASIVSVVDNIIQNYSQYDYVIINDGSKDQTSAISHAKGYNIVDLPVNLGLAGAFQTGLRYAYEKGYKKAVQFDADGQHLPEYISVLEEMIDSGYEMVIGSRFVTEKRENSLRMLGNTLISGAIKLTTGKTINDPTSGMRMFSENLIKEFALNINYGPEPDTVSYLIRHGVKVAEAQVRMRERQAGESYLTFSRSIQYMIHMFASILIIQNFRKRG